MTAPGNSVLLLTLLALLLSCTGYAAGRLHQWYRMGLDRDEAYREGYDTATRSVFSLAARIIGPRRDRAAIRASASVGPSVVGPSSAESSARSGRRPPHPAVASSPRGVSSSVVSPEVFALSPAEVTPVVSAAGSSPVADASSAAGFSSVAEREDAEETGRHTVPDELVRAATYRLPPDRVARAKVRSAAPRGLPDDAAQRLPETTPHVSVPKPRSS